MSKSGSNKDDDNHGDAHETPTSFVYKDDIEDDTKFRPQTLWDNTQRKLLLFIMEGVGIIPPEGGIQIKLRYEPSKTQKLKYKTAPQYSEDPKWNELCYFDLSSFTQGISADDLAKCQLTMEYVSVKKNASLGEAVLCVPTGATSFSTSLIDPRSLPFFAFLPLFNISHASDPFVSYY
jgi:hypothetical protein